MSASLASGKRGTLRAGTTRYGIGHVAMVLAGCALVLVLRFVLDTFNFGQVNTVVALLAVAHIYFYARDRKALSAVTLVLAISIKLTPALLLVYHMAKLRLKFAVSLRRAFAWGHGDELPAVWSRRSRRLSNLLESNRGERAGLHACVFRQSIPARRDRKADGRLAGRLGGDRGTVSQSCSYSYVVGLTRASCIGCVGGCSCR